MTETKKCRYCHIEKDISLFRKVGHKCNSCRAADEAARRLSPGYVKPEVSVERRTLANMKSRCYNPNVESFTDYGGRGIKICDRWLNSSDAFIEDMGPKPGPEYTIERKDVNGDYTPENCVWATRQQQSLNRTDNVKITIGEEVLTVSQLADRVGINRASMKERITSGWDTERLTLPKREVRKYLYRGSEYTLGELVEKSGISWGTLRRRLNELHMSPEDAIDNIPLRSDARRGISSF